MKTQGSGAQDPIRMCPFFLYLDDWHRGHISLMTMACLDLHGMRKGFRLTVPQRSVGKHYMDITTKVRTAACTAPPIDNQPTAMVSSRGDIASDIVLREQPCKETDMPFYERGDVRIHYEEVGSGFPLMIIPGGGLNSTVAGLANPPSTPREEFSGDHRVTAADYATPIAVSPPVRLRLTAP